MSTAIYLKIIILEKIFNFGTVLVFYVQFFHEILQMHQVFVIALNEKTLLVGLIEEKKIYIY
ncbi:hypothetical protein EB001_26460, partial [bacterium]|nr:hypothetical protein [bacterium]